MNKDFTNNFVEYGLYLVIECQLFKWMLSLFDRNKLLVCETLSILKEFVCETHAYSMSFFL